MFGAFLRAAPYAAFGALLAAILSEVMGPILEVMNGTGRAQGTLLYDSLAAVHQNTLIVLIFGIIVGIFARAVIEARLGGI